jgi:Periplasmic copper-binding protein (NosD)
MRKVLVIGIILLFIGASIVSGLNTNSTNSSQPLNRGWLYVGGSGPGNYTTIQSAINAANFGDTIFVHSGIYYEHVFLNGSIYNNNYITLLGENKYTTIIDGFGGSAILRILNGHNNIISRFSLRNAGIGCAFGADKFYCGDNILSDCLIYNNSGSGLLIYGVFPNSVEANNHIINCEIYQNNDYGIRTEIYLGGEVTSNLIYHNNLFNNGQNAKDTDSNSWYNATINEGNYYDDYTGEDTNDDGIGDTPYNISGGPNQDLYPFMQPNGWLLPPPNQPPIIGTPIPANGTINTPRPPAQLQITVTDLNNDPLDVSFHWKNHTGTWMTLQTYTGVGNGTYTFIPPTTNEWIWGNTIYKWSVNVTDGLIWTNETYTYTTSGSRYDVNNNDIVNFQDAGLVWVHRSSLVPYDSLYDVNQDGQVNFQDAGLTWVNRD